MTTDTLQKMPLIDPTQYDIHVACETCGLQLYTEFFIDHKTKKIIFKVELCPQCLMDLTTEFTPVQHIT